MISLTSICLTALLSLYSVHICSANGPSLPSDPNWNWDEIYNDRNPRGEAWNDWYARRYGEQPWWWDVSSEDMAHQLQGLKPSVPSISGARPPAPKGFEVPPLSDIAASYRDHGYAFSSAVAARQMEQEPKMAHQVVQRSVSGMAGLGYARQQMLRSTAYNQRKHSSHRN